MLRLHDIKLGQFSLRQGPAIVNAVVIGHLNYDSHPPCTKRGIVLPFGSGEFRNNSII